MHCAVGNGRLGPLDGERDAVASAKAQTRDSALQTSLLQRIEQCRQDARAAGADRMPERHCSSVDVHLARIDSQLTKDSDQLHRERFVNLEQVNVLELPADLLRHLADGL